MLETLESRGLILIYIYLMSWTLLVIILSGSPFQELILSVENLASFLNLKTWPHHHPYSMK